MNERHVHPDAYREGRDACAAYYADDPLRDDGAVAQNPYPPGSMHAAWRLGWNDYWHPEWTSLRCACGSTTDVDMIEDQLTGRPVTVCADCQDAAREGRARDHWGGTAPKACQP